MAELVKGGFSDMPLELVRAESQLLMRRQFQDGRF